MIVNSKSLCIYFSNVYITHSGEFSAYDKGAYGIGL